MTIGFKSFFMVCWFVGCSASFASSCPSALPTSSSGFCTSFHDAAACHCVFRGVPQSTCNDMSKVYKLMISTYGTLERVCGAQKKDTTPQECIDYWNCYRSGGVTSTGQLCSGTGHSCA